MTEKFDTWAIVELFGHQQIAGRASEEVIAGGTFLRVDVPETHENNDDYSVVNDTFTRFYGASAIYSITPVAEEVARRAAQQLRKEPITVWMPDSGPRALPVGAADDDDFNDEDFR